MSCTCIYSALHFLADRARHHNAKPVVGFDQPLWWKGLMIIDNEPVDSDLKNIVLHLGGFHLEMSFVGCIGHLRSASGLQHVLELVYASNAVTYMLTCKEIARTVRAHMLVDAALNGLLLGSCLECLYQYNQAVIMRKMKLCLKISLVVTGIWMKLMTSMRA